MFSSFLSFNKILYNIINVDSGFDGSFRPSTHISINMYELIFNLNPIITDSNIAPSNSKLFIHFQN